MNNTDRPLTTRDVAAIFGVTATTVKRWAEDGRLPSFKTPGGHYRFAPAAVEALKASSSASPAA